MSDPRSVFAIELAAYAANLQTWLAGGHEGEWVVIKGSECLRPCRVYADAWKSGIDRFQGPGFMVRRILHEQPVYSLSHVTWRANPT